MVIMALWRKNGLGSVFSKLFQTNDDLDTTLNVCLRIFTVFGLFVLVVVMVVLFHDDIKEDAGMIVISAIGMISLAIQSMFPVSNNGRKPNG